MSLDVAEAKKDKTYEPSPCLLEGTSNAAIEGTGKTEVTALQNYYPANDGALGDVQRKFLMPGEQTDRFAGLGGKYFSPKDTPIEARTLPSNADISQYRAFEVIKPFEVGESKIAPFGIGIQFQSPVSAEILLNRGIIRLVP